MPVPMGKAVLTLVRYTLRPINNTLIRMFKAQHAEKTGAGYAFFERFGQGCNRFEVGMNRIIIQQKGLGEVKAIPADMAFNKGVDYFTEIVFFYLVVFAIAFYELDKSNKSRRRTMDRFKAVKTNTTQFS